VTGADVNEATLGAVPSPQNTQNAQNAEHLDNLDSSSEICSQFIVPPDYLPNQGGASIRFRVSKPTQTAANSERIEIAAAINGDARGSHKQQRALSDDQPEHFHRPSRGRRSVRQLQQPGRSLLLLVRCRRVPHR